MTPAKSARIGGVLLGAAVMSVGLILSLELGAWGHALVAGTLRAASDDRATRIPEARLATALAQLRRAPESAVRIEAADRLAQSRDPRAVAALAAALSDRDSAVQRAAALALGEIGDSTAVPALVELLKTSNEPAVRQAAAFSLGVLHHRRAANPSPEPAGGPGPVH